MDLPNLVDVCPKGLFFNPLILMERGGIGYEAKLKIDVVG